MPRRSWIWVGATALCLLAAGVTLMLVQSDDQTGAGAAGSASQTSQAKPTPGSTHASASPDTGSDGPGASPTPTQPATRPTTPSVKNPASSPDKDNPLEVLPPNDSTSPTLPPSAKTPALLTGSAPANASVSGELAAGYPADSLPPEPNSSITSSSIASDGTRVQLSLVAASSTDPDSVLAFYTNTLARYGYFSATVQAAGATEQSYSGPDGTVIVTAQRTPGGTSYSLFASVELAE